MALGTSAGMELKHNGATGNSWQCQGHVLGTSLVAPLLMQMSWM